jgi:hypothetical protein
MTRRGLTILILLLLMGGCSTRGAGPGVATAQSGAAAPSPSASLSDADRQRQFAQCLRDHGVDVQDPDAKGGGVAVQGADKVRANEAMEACQSLLPGGSLSKTVTPEDLDQLRHFAQCLRDHGLDVSDPDPTTGDLAITPDSGISKTDPRFQDAFTACRGQDTVKPGGAK